MAGNMTRDEIIESAKDMDPEKLVEMLNTDIEDFIDKLPKSEKKDNRTIDEIAKDLQNHPLFMTKAPAEGEEMSPLMEALQSLKYDPDANSPNELASSYKDDGNVNFKRKKYRWAVDSYTEGLKTNCTDQELLVQLYSNRAAAHFHIGNYEKSLKDAIAAKSIKNDHLKALQRGALCYQKLNKLQDCIQWCEEGLKVSPSDKLLTELKEDAKRLQKIQDRDKRRAQHLKEANLKKLQATKAAISDRKIQLVDDILPNSENICPDAVAAKVHLDEDSKLIWPVMILYPEYGTSDYIQEFHEDSTFLDQLKVMFENESPGWDEDKKYTIENLQVYFTDDQYIIPVKLTESLQTVLSHKRYKVHNGTPCFLVTAADSLFDKKFRKKHTLAK